MQRSQLYFLECVTLPRYMRECQNKERENVKKMLKRTNITWSSYRIVEDALALT